MTAKSDDSSGLHSRRNMKQPLLKILAAILAAPLLQAAAPPTPADPGWPRQFKQGRATLTVYQPQLGEWTGFTNGSVRCAIAVQTASDKKEIYGILEVNADTIVNRDARTVTAFNGRRHVRFPNLPDSNQAEMVKLVNNLLPPSRPLVISLDRLLAYMEKSHVASRPINVNLDPPKILYRAEPAILIIFLGPPQFKPVEPGSKLLFALNTNWDVFFDSTTGRYYLLHVDHWLEAADPVKGPWTLAGVLPAALRKLPANPNWEDVRANVPGKAASRAPVVLVSTEPAELIVTQGEPTYQPIPGTSLMQVGNTESTVFQHAREGQFYFLVAGRWYRAKSLSGPWQAATLDLPADFRMIPDDSPAAFVKASVRGTREAEDAVLLASVPKQTALTIGDPKALVNVVYDGPPKFIAVQGTTVLYAINSPQAVFLVNNVYYCCDQGVWFTAATPGGVWVLCTSVPAAIYTIPPTSPMYNVTYVVVQSSTPTTVVYQYTSGYEGQYHDAATGLLMFGAGMLIGAALADDCFNCGPWYYSYHCSSCFFSYGCGAVYHGAWGGYYAWGRCYGPYGGAGGGAIYNPSTGGYARGAYRYGPYGAAGAREAYNPHTDTYFAQAGVRTPYGSSGRFYAERGGKEVWGGHESGARGTVAWAQGDQGQGIIGANTRYGQGFVAKDKEGDYYAGHDGNVYKKDENGWHEVEQPLKSSTGTAATRPGAGGAGTQTQPGTTTRPGTGGAGTQYQPGAIAGGTRPGAGGAGTQYQPGTRPGAGQAGTPIQTGSGTGSVRQGLDRDAVARNWGNQRAAQFSGTQRPATTQRPSNLGAGRRR